MHVRLQVAEGHTLRLAIEHEFNGSRVEIEQNRDEVAGSVRSAVREIGGRVQFVPVAGDIAPAEVSGKRDGDTKIETLQN